MLRLGVQLMREERMEKVKFYHAMWPHARIETSCSQACLFKR